jgi:hypothetical protein
VVVVFFVGLAGASMSLRDNDKKWAVVNHGGVDVWLVSPDGVAHAIPPGCRRATSVWRAGETLPEPKGARNWPVIDLPTGVGKHLLQKEKVTLDKRDYYSRQFLTR